MRLTILLTPDPDCGLELRIFEDAAHGESMFDQPAFAPLWKFNEHGAFVEIGRELEFVELAELYGYEVFRADTLRPITGKQMRRNLRLQCRRECDETIRRIQELA